MRKLSVGLVSCTLGIITFVASNVVNATVNETPPAIVENTNNSTSTSQNTELENVGKEKTKPEATGATASETATPSDAVDNGTESETVAEEIKETEEKK